MPAKPKPLLVPCSTPYSKKLLADRYAQFPGETITQVFQRISTAVAESPNLVKNKEVYAQEFFNWMNQGLGCPAGRILSNCGGTGNNMIANCFVLPVEDSRSSIYKSLGEMAEIEAYGGGVGFNFSALRPEGARVRKLNGQASGPVSFIDIYDKSVGTISQGGSRRGAAIAILNANHPDIFKFIDAKRGDHKRWSNFNVSVGITDDFMRAVENDGDWVLSWGEEEALTKVVKAKELFHLIAKAAWESGEPGVFFLDTVNRLNPLSDIEYIEAVNPCVTGDTWVWTTQGPKQVKTLLGVPHSVFVDGHAYESTSRGFFSSGMKPIVQVTTKEGWTLKLTPNHKVAIRRQDLSFKYEWKEAGQLLPGETILLNNPGVEMHSWEGDLGYGQGYLLGYLIGDGCLSAGTAYLSVWNSPSIVARVKENLQSTRDDCGTGQLQENGVWTAKSQMLALLAEGYGVLPGNKTLTPEMETNLSSEAWRGVLSGLFDADGTVGGSVSTGLSVRLSQSNLALLQMVQRVLLRFGILSTIYQNRRKEQDRNLPDGHGGQKKYHCKAQHELSITKGSLIRFAAFIGFSDDTKQDKIAKKISSYKVGPYAEKFEATVDAIIPLGEEEVFDVQVPGVNAFEANGCIVANCGELPMPPYGMCALASLILPNFLTLNSLGTATMDWAKFKNAINTGVLYLDSLLDIAHFPLPEIKEEVLSKRRIGLGVFGLADWLLLQGLAYDDSQETLKAVTHLGEFMTGCAHEKSAELAETYGHNPLLERRVALNRRNATLISMAPTGTISSLYGASWGIEPYYSSAMVRDERMGKDSVSFAVLDHYQATHLHNLPAWASFVIKDNRRFPHTYEVQVKDHLAILTAIANSVDNAVSKTINLPNSATIEDVENVYRTAWANNIKGITIYRDNSRSVQAVRAVSDPVPAFVDDDDDVYDDGLLPDGEDQPEDDDEDDGCDDSVQEQLLESAVEDILDHPKERPLVVESQTYRLKYNPQRASIYITIGDVDGEIFEIFFNTEDSTMREGLDGLSLTLTALFRRGISCKFLIRKFMNYESANGGAFFMGHLVPSALAGIGKVLKVHLQKLGELPSSLNLESDLETENPTNEPEIEVLTHATKCPECHEYAYIHQDGCGVCQECGHSECH